METFAPESIVDDPIRSVCMYTQAGVKYVMKLGNHLSLGETSKYRLLQNEDNMYKNLLQKLGTEYKKYFPSIIDAGDEKDFYYIIMEYIEGITLSDYVNKSLRTPPSAEDVLTILVNLTEALAAMYSTGIVHGDLSAENVMITSDGSVKLIDFEKGSIKNKLSVNTIGSTNLTSRSTELNIIQQEQEPEGLGYLFLAIKLLSVIPIPKSLILSIMRKIFEFEDTDTNVYIECIQIIQDYKAGAGGGAGAGGRGAETRPRGNSPSVFMNANTRKRKIRKRKTRKL